MREDFDEKKWFWAQIGIDFYRNILYNEIS